jgi:hypothetical protein
MHFGRSASFGVTLIRLRRDCEEKPTESGAPRIS